MKLNEIKPFVRFARKLEINLGTIFPEYFPIDARLFYVNEGEARLKVENEEYLLPKGSVIFINSGVAYQILPSKASFIAINFDFTDNFSKIDVPIPPIKTSETEKPKILENCLFSDAICFNNFFVFKDLYNLQNKFVQLENEYIRKLPFYRQKISNILENIIISIARNSEKRNLKQTNFEIEEIIEYIQTNFNKKIDNKIIGKHFNFHPNYISSEFKRITGKPLHHFVLETRILNAISLMEAGYKNTTEIANLSGFSDVNYFTRYFKSVIGTTPAKYLKNCI